MIVERSRPRLRIFTAVLGCPARVAPAPSPVCWRCAKFSVWLTANLSRLPRRLPRLAVGAVGYCRGLPMLIAAVLMTDFQ